MYDNALYAGAFSALCVLIDSSMGPSALFKEAEESLDAALSGISLRSRICSRDRSKESCLKTAALDMSVLIICCFLRIQFALCFLAVWTWNFGPLGEEAAFTKVVADADPTAYQRDSSPS